MLLMLPLAGARAGDTITGVVQGAEAEEGTLQVKVEQGERLAGRTITADVTRGDARIWEEGDRVRGEVIENNGDYTLTGIFPAEGAQEKTMTVINSRLRQDTLLRGRQVYRAIGEKIPDFALYDQRGNLVMKRDLTGKPVVLNFIFTRCMQPTMCPAATQRMGELSERLQDAGVDNYRLVSVTLDPEFDTPGVFHTYAMDRGIDDPNFLFLGGSADAVQDLKKQLGILTRDDDTYILDHTMRTIIISPEGEIVYQVPGSLWSVDDFFNRVKELANPRDA